METIKKNIFYLIAGPIAAGKSTFMENRMFKVEDKDINFFDHDREKLMVKLYAPDENYNNKIFTLDKALNNAIDDSLKNDKDFIIQAHFTNEQLPQINTYFHKYGNKFNMEAHFITVNNIEILKERATKREQLGGHSSEIKSIDKTYEQSFKNFVSYIPKLQKATVWDNSKDYGINTMEPQFIYEGIKEAYVNPSITDYLKGLLNIAQSNLKNYEVRLHKGFKR